jgi:hypothetical protein
MNLFTLKLEFTQCFVVVGRTAMPVSKVAESRAVEIMNELAFHAAHSNLDPAEAAEITLMIEFFGQHVKASVLS